MERSIHADEKLAKLMCDKDDEIKRLGSHVKRLQEWNGRLLQRITELEAFVSACRFVPAPDGVEQLRREAQALLLKKVQPDLG